MENKAPVYTLNNVRKTIDGHPIYDVLVDGKKIGTVEGCNPIFENRTIGRRYVNSRRRSKVRYWLARKIHGKEKGWPRKTRNEAAKHLI